MSIIIPPRFHFKTDMSPRADNFLVDLKHYTNKAHYKSVVKFNGQSTENYKRNDSYCLKKYATERRIYLNERDPIPVARRLMNEKREIGYEIDNLFRKIRLLLVTEEEIEDRIEGLK